MKKSMREGMGEFEPGLSDNEKAIREKEIPGRSLLEENPWLVGEEKEKTMDGHRLTALEIKSNDKVVWRKDVSYRREKDPQTNQDHNTDEVLAISEKNFGYYDDGRLKIVHGRDLHQKHEYLEDYNYDDYSKTFFIAGEVTEGEKKGETWVKTKTVEFNGDFIKKTRIIYGKHFINGELKAFRTVETNFSGPDGKDFLYSSREYDENEDLVPEKNVDWQAEEGAPKDFQEW